MTQPEKPTPVLTEVLLTALAQEVALLATLQAGLQAMAAGQTLPPAPAKQERDFDNIPF